MFLGSNHHLTITMATMMHPFQKAKMDSNSMKVFFVLKTKKNKKTFDTVKSKMLKWYSHVTLLTNQWWEALNVLDNSPFRGLYR